MVVGTGSAYLLSLGKCTNESRDIRHYTSLVFQYSNHPLLIPIIRSLLSGLSMG